MLMNDKLLYDKAFRRKVYNLDTEALTILAYGSIDDAKIKVQTNTRDKMYLVMPKDPESDLLNVQAAGMALSTAGTVATICSSFSTLSTKACNESCI